MNRIAILLFLAFPAILSAQTPLQVLRGRITDADTGQPLAGATVLLSPLGMGTVSDSLGYYRIERVPPGRYEATARYVGYETAVAPEIWVESGKSSAQDFALLARSADMGEVVVRAARSDLRTTCPSGINVLTIEETRRFPAAFFDPARVALSLAGAAGADDQANGISIRGNSPNGMVWRLEGVDIVNPNHTPNAGTFSDRVSAYGGGVNILSAQLLAATHFLSGPFPADYGNALSGVMDMRLRPGNPDKREFTLQAGLIGIDLAAEGPFSSKSDASYLINYRYSTIGLLSAMGLQLGDEDIRFQDLSFHLSFPGRKGVSWTVFGMGGTSVNLFEASRDSSEWEFRKDRYDIRFRSRMGAAGLTRTQQIGRRGQWHTVLAASAMESTREGDRLDDNLTPVQEERDGYDQSKLSLHSVFRYKTGDQHRLRAGLMLTRQFFDIYSLNTRGDTIASGRGGGLLWQPYAAWSADLTSTLLFNAGLHLVQFGFNGTGSVEPRLSLQWSPGGPHRLSLAYGLHSQLQQPQLYFAHTGEADNSGLGFSKAQHLALAWHTRVGQALHFSAEAYYQRLFDVPVEANAPSAFSALNLMEDFTERLLINAGTGRNYGLELSLRQYVTRDAWFMANATAYSSRYTGSDDVERSTRYDGRFIANFSGGKEWRKEKREGRLSRVWGLSGRLIWNGGFRHTPVDAAASAVAGQTVFDDNQAFSLRLRNYFRPDLRVYLQRNKQGRSGTLSLDIQNIANRQNTAFFYYDTQRSSVVERFQLGIIPILSYRLEFF